MSYMKIKFVFAFNAKLNGYLSYNYIALSVYSNKCRGRRIQFYTYKKFVSLTVLTNTFFPFYRSFRSNW